jgi:hypothetical protein
MMCGGMICSETKCEGFLRISCLCSLQQIISGTAGTPNFAIELDLTTCQTFDKPGDIETNEFPLLKVLAVYQCLATTKR